MNIQSFQRNYYGIRRAGWAICFAILIGVSFCAREVAAYVELSDPIAGIELEVQIEKESHVHDGEPGPQSDGSFIL